MTNNIRRASVESDQINQSLSRLFIKTFSWDELLDHDGLPSKVKHYIFGVKVFS